MAGLKPLRHLSGGKTFRTRTYPVVTSGAVYVGDPVRVSSGVVKPVGTAVSAAVLGAVAYFLDSNGKPLTHSLPSGGIYKPAGSSGYRAAVYDDPDIIYEVVCDASIAATNIGGVARVSGGTPVTALGQSGYKLNTTVSAGDGAFRIIGAAATDSSLDGDDNAIKAEVVISRHAFKLNP